MGKQDVETVVEELKEFFEDPETELDYDSKFADVRFGNRPYNPISGAEYSGTNFAMLVYASIARGYEDPRWMTFNQAIYKEDNYTPSDLNGVPTDEHFADWDENCHVKKGSDSVPIIIWNPYEKELTEEQYKAKIETNPGKFDDYPYDEYNPDDPPTEDRIYMDTARLFNAEDIAGVPEYTPDHAQSFEQDWEPNAAGEYFFDGVDVPVVHTEGTSRFAGGLEAKYVLAVDESQKAALDSTSMENDTIYIPPKKYFPSAHNYYATKLHEWSHSTGHPDRLDRPSLYEGKRSRDPESEAFKQYAREEFRAEMGSSMLKARLGIEANTDHLKNHAAYMKGWLSDLEENPYELVSSGSEAKDIVEFAEDNQLIPDPEDLQDPVPDTQPDDTDQPEQQTLAVSP